MQSQLSEEMLPTNNQNNNGLHTEYSNASELASLTNSPKNTSKFHNRTPQSPSSSANKMGEQNYNTMLASSAATTLSEEEYALSASHNIHHERHLLRHPTRGGPIARMFDKFSLSPHFRRFCLIGMMIWFVLLTPAAWMPMERIACESTTTGIPNVHRSSSSSSFIQSELYSNHHNNKSYTSHHKQQHRTEDNDNNNNRDSFELRLAQIASAEEEQEQLSSSFNYNNSHGSLPFCKESADPDPLRWAAGIALIVSLGCLIISTIFSELAAHNICNYEKHTEVLGILPLVIFRTIMISGIITAYSIQLWFLIILKRPSCPETNHPCALYRLTEPALTLGLVCAFYVVFFMIGCVALTFGVEKKLTPGLVKRILLSGLPPEDEENIEPGSPHFVALHQEVFADKCNCDNCLCSRDSGCCYAIASCMDDVRVKYHVCWNVDDRCPPPFESCNQVFCCDLDEEIKEEPQPFKATLKNAFLQAFLGSFSPALGYFLLISTILLMESNANGTSWTLVPAEDSWFSCHDLFPAVQNLPSIKSGDDEALFRLSSQSNAEVLICTNLSDFDPTIKALPGILRTPNYITSDFPRCSFHDVYDRCQGPYCSEAYNANPTPFGVFFSYKFYPVSGSACTFDVYPRPGVINCTQTNVIRLSGLGESLIGKSFLLPPFALAIIMRFSAPLFAIVFLFIRMKWYIRADQQEDFRKHYGKHKKHYLEAFACDTLFANFVVAFIDPERFSELPDPPRYRMAMVSVQVCEFLIWIFRVQPCWRWYAVVFVCVQGYLLVKSVYNLYRDEIMIARSEMSVEARKRRGEVVESETDDHY